MLASDTTAVLSSGRGLSSPGSSTAKINCPEVQAEQAGRNVDDDSCETSTVQVKSLEEIMAEKKRKHDSGEEMEVNVPAKKRATLIVDRLTGFARAMREVGEQPVAVSRVPVTPFAASPPPAKRQRQMKRPLQPLPLMPGRT